MKRHRGHSGSTVAIKQIAIDHYEKKYQEKNNEELKEIRSKMSNFIKNKPDDYYKTKDYKLRIKAINNILDKK